MTASVEERLAAALDPAARAVAPAGLAAAVRCGRHGGEVVAVRAFGEPRRDGRSTTASTVFRIASLSKSFLAGAALRLRDDGLLDLHAPAAEYVPELAAARWRGRRAAPTVADLLANRSGLTEDNPWGDRHLGDSRADIAEIVAAGLPLSALPGTTYQYSNLGMSLVGRAIERVTGAPVEQVIADRILRPLHLGDTRWSADDFPEDADVATGFRTFDEGHSFVSEPFVGSGALGCIGGLFSTVTDIGRWLGFLSAAFDEEPGADAPLSARSRREMQSVQTVIPAAVERFAGRPLVSAGYGYGLVVEYDTRLGRTVGHSGGLPGFAAHMRWHPASGWGVVAFGNSDEFPAWRVTAAALEALTPDPVPSPSSVWPETWSAALRLDEVIRRGEPLASAAGVFSSNVLADIPADVRDRSLRALIDTVGAPLPAPAALAERIVSAPEPSTLRWTVPAERGTLTCQVHLMGLHRPTVQAFSVS